MRRLPDGWSEPSALEDAVDVDGVSLHRAGIASTSPWGEEVTGSAAGPSADVADRGWFELLERASTLAAIHTGGSIRVRDRDGAITGHEEATRLFGSSDEPARWRYARSNGVAIHATWELACDRALWELVERDHVLRSWYGELAPRRVLLDLESSPLAASSSYDWEAYAFEDLEPAAWSAGISVVGVFGLPRRTDVPLVLGYGARPDLAGAMAAAASEAAQLLAFLWGEDLPTTRPELGPTAMHHLDHLLWPETTGLLRDWLAGGHLRYGPSAAPRPASAEPPRFADLTPAWIGGGLRVAKAVCPAAVPLAFGDAPFGAHLPGALRAHPVA